ncbi:hypothetical protein A5740_24695 [Mycobacterium sp. GA-1841]|uniref:DUF4189 domain-containing protein n=1 Tax=Mycobacterium sp. GA-1841 TaxID=1834154 RepID=UPI00096E86D2|nr:DUF4189 domain-containing protein [Mycobacterium sp. GA-1841]OMC40211.1 hypothetical protein A5740_24695 [Mycobacterium sp. GA-1841]
MATIRHLAALGAAGIIVAGVSIPTAWEGGPGGVVENSDDDSYAAVGTGTFHDALVGFRATGDTRAEAAQAVVAKCQAASGGDCTSDAETNDNLCIVSVADDASDVVVGGAGATVEAAREDAVRRAAAQNMPVGPAAAVVISDCP